MNNQVLIIAWGRYKRFAAAAIATCLAVITALVYFPSLWYGFMFDDLPTITNYIHARYIDFVGQFFRNPRWISRLLNQWTFCHWKTDPFAYRIVDLAMHIAIGILAFVALYRLLSHVKKNVFLKEHSLLLATLTSMLILLHPVQTQTATYITQMRLEGLVVLFTMLVLTLFAFAATAKSSTTQMILYALSFAAIAFAGGTKEIIVVLPGLLVLADWFLVAEGDWASFKSRLWVHALYFIILYGVLFSYGFLRPSSIKTTAVSVVRNNRGNILTTSAAEPITSSWFAISQFKVLLHYIFIFFWPFSLSFDYDVVLSKHWYSLDVTIPFLVLMFLITGALFLYRRYGAHIVTFGFFWFLTAMLPRTSIFPTTELVCDYKTFPASFGMMVLIGFLLAHAIVWLHAKIETFVDQHQKIYVPWALVGSLCVAVAVASGVRNIVWRSELDFWGDVMKKAPKSRVMNNYAIALWETGKTQEAIDYFYKAIEKDNSYAEPHVNLGTIYQARNQNDKAMEHYKRALEIGEGHPELFHNLGMLHFANKSWAAAEYCLKQAIELRSFNGKTHFNLGKLYQILNRLPEALACYEQAVKYEFTDKELFYLYGSLCFDMGMNDKAIAILEHVDKNFQDTAFLLGCCYYTKPCYAKAEEYFQYAYQKHQNNAIYIYNYAQSLLNLRKYQEAVVLFDKLVGQPGNKFPYASLHRAKCLYELGQKDGARNVLKKLLTNKQLPKEVISDARLLQKELKFA